jgi:hypothetical protein
MKAKRKQVYYTTTQIVKIFPYTYSGLYKIAVEWNLPKDGSHYLWNLATLNRLHRRVRENKNLIGRVGRKPAAALNEQGLSFAKAEEIASRIRTARQNLAGPFNLEDFGFAPIAVEDRDSLQLKRSKDFYTQKWGPLSETPRQTIWQKLKRLFRR